MISSNSTDIVQAQTFKCASTLADALNTVIHNFPSTPPISFNALLNSLYTSYNRLDPHIHLVITIFLLNLCLFFIFAHYIYVLPG